MAELGLSNFVMRGARTPSHASWAKTCSSAVTERAVGGQPPLVRSTAYIIIPKTSPTLLLLGPKLAPPANRQIWRGARHVPGGSSFCWLLELFAEFTCDFPDVAHMSLRWFPRGSGLTFRPTLHIGSAASRMPEAHSWAPAMRLSVVCPRLLSLHATFVWAAAARSRYRVWSVGQGVE